MPHGTTFQRSSHLHLQDVCVLLGNALFLLVGDAKRDRLLYGSA